MKQSIQNYPMNQRIGFTVDAWILFEAALQQYVHVAVAQQSLQNGWLSVGRKKNTHSDWDFDIYCRLAK